LWRMHFFITEPGLTQNFGFELELNKFLNAFALEQNLWPLFVNRHAQPVFLGKEKCVLLWKKFETEFVQQAAKFLGLLGCQRVSVRIHSPMNRNAPRPTLNSEFDIGRSALGVRRFFNVATALCCFSAFSPPLVPRARPRFPLAP